MYIAHCFLFDIFDVLEIFEINYIDMILKKS